MRPSLDSPLLLALSVALPLIGIALFLAAYRRRRARLERFGTAPLVGRLVPPTALRTPAVRVILIAIAAVCVGIAMAGPRWGLERTRVTGSGIDLVLALDASLSMMATDVRPNRLEVVKQEVRRLRALSGTDRVGLIAFAGRSYILSPLTVDDGAIELFLDNLDPSIVGQAGSSLSRAIRQGTELLVATRGGSDRALVVISDGEAFEPEEDVREVAKQAGDQGISVVTVGIGTERGSTIPVEENGRMTQKRDENGAIVVTKYSPTLLRAAADAAEGTFIPADVTDKAAQIRNALAGLRAQQRSVDVGREQTPRFQLFLIPALLCLIADTLLAERLGRRPRAPAAAEPAMTTSRVALVVALALSPPQAPFQKQDPAVHYEAERYGEAIAEFRRMIGDGDDRPETLYNLGTALLAADSSDAAIEVLDRATHARPDEVRYRALFNLGLAHLRRGLAADDGPDRDRSLDAALAAYKSVLIMRPDDGDAKWNYELALRKQSGGGGGADESPPQQGQESPNAPPTPAERPAGGLGRQQAEQILNSAARDERDVQDRRRDRAPPPRPRVGKDW